MLQNKLVAKIYELITTYYAEKSAKLGLLSILELTNETCTFTFIENKLYLIYINFRFSLYIFCVSSIFCR